MSEESGFQSSAYSGPSKRWRVRSISTIASGIVILCLAMLAVICIVAVGSMRTQSAKLDYLILIVVPAIDNNTEIFRDMTVAQSAMLRYQLSSSLKNLVPYREARVRILAAITPLHTQIADLAKSRGGSFGESIVALEAQQRDAIKLWLANAQKRERAVLNSESPNFTQSAGLFEDFRDANSQIDELAELERTWARSQARAASARGSKVVIAASSIAAVLMLFFGLRLARSISKPIVALSGIVKRHREGDLTVRARENQGSDELRDLAHDFNLLVEHEAELERSRSLTQHMRDLGLNVEIAIRSAANIRQVLEIVCVELGKGLAVDRVVTTSFDSEQLPTLSAQWHRPDLPPLGKLPDDDKHHVSVASAELWKTSRHIASDRRPEPEAQTERMKAFYSYTNAQATVVVPIGLGDRVLGGIYVLTTTKPRDWAWAEVNAVDRVAAIVAQFIVEQTHRDQLSEHVERLELLGRQKDTFVATVSHELRTPLTSIIGYLEVLKDGYAGDVTEEQERMLDVMDRNATRLLSLIQDLLALNKRESETANSEMVAVSMSDLITTACQDLTPLAESGAIKIECDAGPAGSVVQGDKGRLQSVVVNIVSNAIKFSPRGAEVTVRCTLDEPTSRVLFTCQDRGIGIPAADQGELFTRFYRASNAMSMHIPGTGLGLTIVKQIVDDHGGEIRLTSVEGKGTTVVIDLPLSPPSL